LPRPVTIVIQRSAATVPIHFYKPDLCAIMHLPVLRHWDLGIYLNMYNHFIYSDWLVTSKGNSVFHTCMPLELSPHKQQGRSGGPMGYNTSGGIPLKTDLREL